MYHYYNECIFSDRHCPLRRGDHSGGDIDVPWPVRPDPQHEHQDVHRALPRYLHQSGESDGDHTQCGGNTAAPGFQDKSGTRWVRIIGSMLGLDEIYIYKFLSFLETLCKITLKIFYRTESRGLEHHQEPVCWDHHPYCGILHWNPGLIHPGVLSSRCHGTTQRFLPPGQTIFPVGHSLI